MSNIIIKKPIVSEKSFALAANGVYVFHVDASANKHSVAGQIHKLFKVDVVSVNIINIAGKVKGSGKKIGKRSDIKKALVRVKKGQKIAIFEEEKKENKKEETTQISHTDKTQMKEKK